MKELIILGAAGSIGSQTLDIVRRNSQDFKVIALSVGRNIVFARQIIAEFKPSLVCTRSQDDMLILKKEFPKIEFVYGDSGLIDVATYRKEKKNVLLVVAVVGSVGLKPTIEAIKIGRNIALANKETLVMAGDLVMKLAKEKQVTIFPIDSEHSAIYQCLVGEDTRNVKRLIITASGGSFRNLSREDLKNVCKEDALKHPNWQMGEKITIDSSTMMNKGFEVIEAHHLFGLPYEQIATVLHPESLVHSMVEFTDSSIKAQLGVSDMRIPISYALSYPKRIEYSNELNLLNSKLTFSALSYDRFPCLKMAIEAAKKGNIYPAVLNASNEAAVRLFLADKISYLEIEKIISDALRMAQPLEDITIDKLLAIDRQVKDEILLKYKGEGLC